MDPIVARGYPEGKVKAEPGTLYLDADTGLFYYNSGDGPEAKGWVEAGASGPDHTFPDSASVVAVGDYKRYRTSNNFITNFTGGRDQQVIFLSVDRSSSIQANANINDAFTGPGRVSYMLDGGKWYMVVTRSIP